MRWPFRNRSIEDLRLHSFSNPVERKEVSILVIDDNEFSYLELLRRHDFNIKQLNDIHDIQAVSSYDIVLCDIKGVGKHFGSPDEGGHLIQEIKKRYPFKILIGYSAKQHDPEFNRYFSLCDFIPKKDVGLDEWVDILDKAIADAVSPMNQWRAIHHQLVDMNIGSQQVVRLEDNFVRAVLHRTVKFPEERQARRLPQEARTLLADFAVSLLFRCAGGLLSP